jgi:hypothetical protein
MEAHLVVQLRLDLPAKEERAPDRLEPSHARS